MFNNKSLFGVLLILFFSFISCISNTKRIEEIRKLRISDGNSTIIFIDEDTYEVFYIGNSATKVNIGLSKSEKDSIYNKFKESGLDRLPTDFQVLDDCYTMPKISTTINFIKGHTKKSINIDLSCDKYNIFYKSFAYLISEFVQFVYNIVNHKDKIRTLPKSNYPYL